MYVACSEQLSGNQAITTAMKRVERYGAGIVAVRHGSFHLGSARRDAVEVPKADRVGIVM